MKMITLFLMFFISVNIHAAETAAPDGKDLYLKNCSSCHHPERYGVSGPPLIPETIGKKKDAELSETVKNGLPATNMPSFKTSLRDEEVSSIVSYIKTPAKSINWGSGDMLLTRNMAGTRGLSPKPAPDMQNLFMVVEGGKGDVHFMDGNTFSLLDRIHVGAIHGGPKYDNSLKNVYMAGRDGWIVKYDLAEWREIGRFRAGVNTRNIAVSKDDGLVAVANSLPENIVFIDTKGFEPLKIIGLNDKPGAVYAFNRTNEFVLSFRERPEIWIINSSSLDIRKIETDQPFSDFFIEPGERYLIGTSREGKNLSVVDLKEKKVVSRMEGTGMPHLASAAVWSEDGRTFAAFPHIKEPVLSVIELYKWESKGTVPLKGAGFFARTHENIPAIWVDCGTDAIQIIDKKGLKVAGEVVPSPGKKAMHIEFTKDGRFALVSVWENEGFVVIYDTSTLKEVKRLPFSKPVGKYNATNKKY